MTHPKNPDGHCFPDVPVYITLSQLVLQYTFLEPLSVFTMISEDVGLETCMVLISKLYL